MNYATWRLLKQEFLLAGRVMPEGGNLRVEYELFDVAKQQRILGEAKIAPAHRARDVAHQVADSSTRRSSACVARSGRASPTSPRAAPAEQSTTS